MKKIIAKVDFNANGIGYIAGDELNGLSYNQILKLNEQGLIEPLNYPSLGFSRQERWSGLPFPSPLHESEM